MTCCVYVISFGNGKFYVGVSSRLKSRLLEHERSSRSLVGRAMAKHNWTCEIIFTGSKADCFDQEVAAIRRLGTRHPAGYNLTDGGEGSVNLDADARASIAKKTKARMLDPAAKKKIVDGNRRRWTQERRAHQSALMREKYLDPLQRSTQAERVKMSISSEERARRSSQALKNWSDPVCAEAMMKRSLQ